MSKGGSTSTTVEIPEYIEEAAKRNLTRADAISRIGYVPYYGADVAAMTPLQQAAMQNVAGQAGAFGLATPAGGPMAGMPAPQEFAGGVMGYSSAPMYEEALAELGARRPGQKRFIDELFIDPFTGAISAAAAPLLDYTTAFPATPVAPVDTGDSGGGGGGGGGYTGATDAAGVPAPYLGVDPYDPSGTDTFLTDEEFAADVKVIQDAIGDPTYDPRTDVLTEAQREAIESSPDRAEIIQAQDEIYMNQQQIYGEPTGNQVTSLVTGGYTGGGGDNRDFERQLAADMQSQIEKEAAGYAASGKTFDMNDPSTWSTPAQSAMTTAREDSFGSDLTRSLTDDTYDPPGNVVTRALGITDTSDSNDDGKDDSGGGGDGCVIATHAVSSGGFTPSMKREAVVWCMNVLHDKWWGEAIRRGYRHLGRKKIEQGKAHEHYKEFRDYIAFANGKKRTLKGAINFTFRTAQFFAVGLIKKEA